MDLLVLSNGSSSEWQFSIRSMYSSLINNGHIERNKFIWKLKMQIKSKIFMWFLFKGVILTKDNLARRNWNGSKTCCFFFMKNETIQHILFDCHITKFLWRIVYISFGLKPPDSISNVVGNWLGGVDSNIKNLIFIGASALCQALWLSRNDVMFDKSPNESYMQVLFRAAHWLRFWAHLQKCEEHKEILYSACRNLEITVIQIFANYGWRFTKILQ